MAFHPRLGDVLLGVFALLLVLAVMHRAETYSHHAPSKAQSWPRRVA